MTRSIWRKRAVPNWDAYVMSYDGVNFPDDPRQEYYLQ